jgi:hypothetical protein
MANEEPKITWNVLLSLKGKGMERKRRRMKYEVD